MENLNKKIRPLMEVVYLGYIGEDDYMERSAVVKLQQLEKPLIMFSPELSTMDSGQILYSKDKPEEVGEDGFASLFPHSPARDLKHEDKIIIYLYAHLGDIIHDDSLRIRYAGFNEQTSFKFTGKLEYQPESLKDAGLIPYKGLLVSGPVVKDEFGDYFIDADIPVILKESLFKDGILKIGDWVETKHHQIYFVKNGYEYIGERKKITDNEGTKILLIDKDPFLLKMYSMKLEEAGFDVVMREDANDNGGNFVDVVYEMKPNLIISDILFHGRDGIEAMMLLKNDPRTKDIPVIILSNQSQPSDIEGAKKVGYLGYLIKADSVPSGVVKEVKRLLRLFLQKNKKNE